jgi:hypothetical protein
MMNKKNLDNSFDAMYTLRKRNLLNQTGKGKKTSYSSDELILSRLTGLDDVLRNITGKPQIIGPITEWTSSDPISPRFIFPGPIIPDGQGNYYIGSINNPGTSGLIVKVDSNGNKIASYNAPVGLLSNSSQGGSPSSLVFYNGFLYGSDEGKHFIFRLDPATSSWVVLLGLPENPGFVNGVGSVIRLWSPISLISDNAGILYFLQENGINFAISKYVISTGVLSSLTGTGITGFADGPGNTAQFNRPSSIFFDISGNIIVCDMFNHRIRKIDKNTQVVTTVAGTGSATSLDGPVSSATFVEPSAGCSDSNGNLYIVSKTANSAFKVPTLIRKISNGIVTSIFTPGNGLPILSDITNINFFDGYIYVSEQSNSTTLRFSV